MKKILLLLALLLTAGTTHGKTLSAPEDNTTPNRTESYAKSMQRVAVPASIDKWITSTFAKGKIPPFSFLYNGKNSADFIRKWHHSINKVESDQEGVVRYDVIYTDPVSALQIKCEVSGFRNYGAVEWILYITNKSDRNSGQITQLKCVDLTLQSSAEGEFKLLHANGNNALREDFMSKIDTIATGTEVSLSPINGHSSDSSAFPFFNIISPDNKGVVVAIGWTGTWYASMLQESNKKLNLATGMKTLDLHLYPEESIRTPRVAMLFWQGEDFMAGQNAFRQLMLSHYTRKIDDEYGHSPMCGGFDWGDPSPCNEYTALTEEYAIAMIKRHKQFGIIPEVFWLDAGWYDGCGAPNFEGKNWFNTVGNWKVDEERFPRGLKPVADAAHAIGSKLMVWFEPERVYPGTLFAEMHPEWIISVPGRKNMLYNLGDRQALEWLCKYIGDFIEENAIDYYRQDFNMPISPFWEYTDEEGRIGISEIRYIEGLYAYWDYLLTRFPDMVFDNCAAGGRRLDLETMRRSIPLWRTDYNYGEVNGYQCHTYGLSMFLPLHGTGIYKCDYYSFLSGMSSAAGMNWAITVKGEKIQDMQRTAREFKELRPYYLEDFYPLSGICDLTSDKIWLAYQFNKEEDDSGIVVAFRRPECENPTYEVKLRGLVPETVYQVNNVIEGTTCEMRGSELMEKLTLSAAGPRSAILLKYKAVD